MSASALKVAVLVFMFFGSGGALQSGDASYCVQRGPIHSALVRSASVLSLTPRCRCSALKEDLFLPTHMKSGIGLKASMGGGIVEDITQPRRKLSLAQKISKISNYASLLCIIDCTVLPILSFAMPAMSFLGGGAYEHTLHEIGHAVALYFVLPVGSTSAISNYATQKNKKILPLLGAFLGLFFIYAANGSIRSLPIIGSLISSSVAHSLHCGGALHRIFNLCGCGLLIVSNRISHKAVHSAEGGCECGSNHDQ